MREEYEGVPQSRKVSVLTLAVVVFLGAIVAIVGALCGWFTPDENQNAVGTIQNAPSVSAAPSADSSMTPTESPSAAPFETEPVSDDVKALIQSTVVDGINAFSTPDSYTDTANTYFYSYKDHLPSLYAAGLIGDATVQSIDAPTLAGKMTVTVSIGQFEGQKVTGYWSETINQFKVTDVELTNDLSARLVPNAIESVKS